MLAGVSVRAQTLAHKGWAGNGLNVAPWWKNAVFYQLDPLRFEDAVALGTGALGGIAGGLEYLQGLGVDAIVLSPFPLEPGGQAGAGAPWAAAYGSTEDFDRLEQEASRRKMRVMVDLPLSGAESPEQTAAQARFWLSRGVGGLRLTGGAGLSGEQASERVRMLRRVCAGYPGDRVLLADLPGLGSRPEEAPVRQVKRRRSVAANEGSAQLSMDDQLAQISEWNAGALRAILAGESDSSAVMVSDAAGRARGWDRSAGSGGQSGAEGMAKIVATALFAGKETPMLLSGQENGSERMPGGEAPTGGDSLLDWYRTLSKLRHTQESLQDGRLTVVETGYPDVVAWVRQGTSVKDQPVLVVCNLSARPVLISLAQPMHQAGVDAKSGIEPLAGSFTGTKVSYTADGIALPAYGVYIGGVLRPGLEDSPAPYLRSRRRGL